MDRFILSAKAHQIFLSVILSVLLLSLIPDAYVEILVLKIILIQLPYFCWVFILGRALNNCSKKRYQQSETAQLVFASIYILIFAFIAFFSVGRITFHGWGLLLPILMLSGFFYLVGFAARALVLAERLQGHERWRDYWLEFVLILLPFVGIWFLQPRINAIYREYWQE